MEMIKDRILHEVTELHFSRITLTTCFRRILSIIDDEKQTEDNDFKLNRLFEWLQEGDKREPAQTKFTEGMTRQVAKEIEFLLKKS